jgi:indolepyruvate ferredoxin oxidoreductase, beta subunit
MSEIKKILILALGGEGGGTLTEWLVEAGLACGWPIQATSIPGVAQRTGATSYYIECLPRTLAAGEAAPPMCLAPLAGDLDLIVSSELLETARAVERGLPHPRRTRIISSTARSLTTQERMHMQDGRFDGQAITQAATQACAELQLLDMSALAREHGTVVSAVMFGALAGCGVLALPREVCEQVLCGGDAKSARSKASLAGFAAGFSKDKWHSGLTQTDFHDSELIAIKHAIVQGIELPQALTDIASHGFARVLDHQDAAYAKQYLQTVQAFCALDAAPYQASLEAARTLALWMAYEDVIRVADLKSRRSRFEQIRRDYGAKPHEPLVVRDFFKPGIAEIADILPPGLSQRLTAWGQARQRRTGSATLGDGMQLATSTVSGLLAMRSLAGLRWLRRKSVRFANEQALIARWLALLHAALRQDGALAIEVARLPSLIKGYSDTHARGKANFLRITQHLLEPALLKEKQASSALTSQLRQAIEAASAAPDGHALLDTLGLPRPTPQPLREQVIHFARPRSGSRLP